jgi:hypothetical protein
MGDRGFFFFVFGQKKNPFEEGCPSLDQNRFTEAGEKLTGVPPFRHGKSTGISIITEKAGPLYRLLPFNIGDV